MIKISIIIAVYNIENYLRKCLDSVTKQAYKNLEIVIIDDGSTDNSLNICLEYQSMDSRIKVIHQENKGLSAARNRGFKESTGEYVWFIDGDDYIESNSLEIINNYIDKYDIIEFNYSEVVNDKIIYVKDLKKYDNENQKYMLSFIMVWNKIFKRKILEGEKFPEGYIHEDIYLIPTLGLKTNKIYFLDDFIYNYVYRKSSITNSGFKLNDKLYVLNNLDKKLGLKYNSELEFIYINNLIMPSIVDKILKKHNYNYREINNIMKNKFPKYYKNNYWNKNGIVKKIFLLCFYYNIYWIPIILTHIKIKMKYK